MLSAEHFHPVGGRNNLSDDGAVQMLLELKYLFDVVDSTARFEDYRLLILPDDIPVEGELAERLGAYVAGGGKIIASWHSGLDSSGAFALDAGISRGQEPVPFRPVFMTASPELDPGMTAAPFVVYETADPITAEGATVLGQLMPSYFNRTYKHFCSHQNTPDDPDAAPLGAAVTEHNGIGYVAFPVFRLYHAMGQPLYKYIVRGLINRLMPDPAVVTSLPSSGRVVSERPGGRPPAHSAPALWRAAGARQGGAARRRLHPRHGDDRGHPCACHGGCQRQAASGADPGVRCLDGRGHCLEAGAGRASQHHFAEPSYPPVVVFEGTA